MINTERLEQNIAQVEVFLNNLEQEMLDNPAQKKVIQIEYNSFERHLHDLQTQLAGIEKELIAVG